MELADFDPKPQLVATTTRVAQPLFPVIDAHNHLGEEFGGGWNLRPVSELLAVMDEARVVALVDLDGGWGEEILDARLSKFKQAAPERFVCFGGVNWREWENQGDPFGEWAARRMRAQASRGAQGLKIWKPLGLTVRDHKGVRVTVDDPRLDPIWETAADLAWPVVIHVADPVAFFEPLDPHNERWEELQVHPEWHVPSPPYPAFLDIVSGLENVVVKHPRTQFIGAHVGCYAENLEWVSRLLERCPNFHVDLAGRVAELGRQPYTARRFLLRFADRVLFGLDLPAAPDVYRLHYRFLETDDEYFAYDLERIPSQGRWRIYGLHLPAPVLEKVYYGNAARLILRR